MKKVLTKLHLNRPGGWTPGSTRRQRASDSNSRASTSDDTLGHGIRAAGLVASASIGVPILSNSELLQQISPSPSPATTSAHNPSTSINNDQLKPPEVNISAPGGGWMATAYNGTKMVLEVVRESSDVFVPLKSIVGGLSALLKQYDQFIANKDDVRRLIGRVELLTTSFTGPPRENDIREIERRRALEGDLKRILETLDSMLNQSKFSNFLNNADQAAKITGVVEDIRDAIMDYQTSIQQGLNENAIAIIESAHLVIVDKLPRAKGAGYQSGDRQKCLRGTRVKVLEAIENWVQDHRSRRVYWLNGVAGTGKTTIAQSFAERMFAEGLLGASFFCSRDFPDRRSLHSIFPTLAFQLAYKYPNFRAHLVQIIAMNPDVGHESLSNQLNKLLVEPLRSTGLSTVIIIDALDECEDNQPASAILSLLSREIDQIASVKFFITGRPEPQIRSGFRLPTLGPLTEILLLHEVEPADVNEDIKLFLEYHFKELVKNRSDIDVTTPWPAPEDIRIVISKAGGLFIYASTVIKFVASAIHMPQERLWMITSMPNSSFHEGKSEIDPLYTCLLEKGCADVDSGDSYFSRLLLVVGSVVLLCEPISVLSLAMLLDQGSKVILNSIRSLHSVILVPDSDSKPIRVFHKSFPDYITDHERCKNSWFYVDSSVHHARLAIRCFELMKTGLKKNICNLPHYAMNQDVDDLSIRRQEFVCEALVYACRFWTRHLCSMSQTEGDVTQILGLLKDFLQRQLLQWLEVLSIVKDLRGAVHSLTDVEQWLLRVNASDEGLLNLIRECRRFVLYSFDPIEQSAAHIYDSVLLWLPASSLVRSLYQSHLTTQVRLLDGVENSWDACIRSIQLGDAKAVFSVAFSHGGNLIAGCNGPTAKILEATTGVCLATLNGHDLDVRSAVFSPDDVFLVSGSSDCTVKIWDVQTGALIRTLKGHTRSVVSVAFSPSGTLVASGSSDTTIRIWTFPSGRCDRILEHHSSPVQSVCWLRTNEIVSGCKDRKVKVWDVSNGECLKTFSRHTGRVWSVASSPDSSKIASASDDETVQVYDSHTGEILQTIVADEVAYSVSFSPDGDKIVYTTSMSVVVWDLAKEVSTFKWQSAAPSVACSPDGSYVAAASFDRFVRVFKMEIGNQDNDVSDQHLKEVLCVSFSADGRMIASGSKDRTLKIWNTTTGSRALTFRGHHNWIRSVAFSPDSSLIASASSDRTIRIWSLHDNSTITTLEGHESRVFGVKFSPDGRRMVSVSQFQEIILWNVEKWEKLGSLPSPTTKELDSRISFSTDGNRVILEFRDTVKMWNILPSVEHPPEPTAGPSSSAKAVSLPMALIPIQDSVHAMTHERMGPYRHPMGSEWVLDQDNRRVCWIPADRRRSDFYDKRMILGTTSGKVVVVDLSDTSVS